MPTTPLGRWSFVVLRLMVDVSLALHFAAAAFWWWLSPKGFPLDRSQFWMNSVLPLAAMAVAFVGLFAMHRGNRGVAAAAVAAFASAWAAAAIAGRVIFPVSLAGVWWLFLLVAFVGGVIFALLLRGERRMTPMLAVGVAAGALVGVGVVWLQIPRLASTVPLGAASPLIVGGEQFDALAAVRLGPNGLFHPAAELVALRRGDVAIHCSPLLDFHRISPDGFWSLFAPRGSSTERHCVGQSVIEETQLVKFSDGSTILLPRPIASDAIEITAYTPLKQNVFSHLNSFCVVDVRGHKSLSLTFSPCSATKIDVRPADYPFGRPARFAFLDAADNFLVVEATSGEKGPFRILTSGRLRRGEPLTIGIHDDGQLIGSVTLYDWSSQVSTDLSPTAGWGLPVNAIEFQRGGDDDMAPATIWITLAGTSVGRGFETVGHRAGTYRNKIRFQL